MDVFIIGVTALLASLLTFFSGFGLGTILTPVFAIFFPAQIAIAQTSVVHFINNIFKLVLIGRHINKKIVFAFGLPAIAGAFAGAYVLIFFSEANSLFVYHIAEKEFVITPLKIIIGILIILFSIIEVGPAFAAMNFNKGNLLAGGLISGFFGGLSGHQGALRSAFLIRYNLSKEEYISTGVAIACLTDITRISLYLNLLTQFDLSKNSSIILIAIVCAVASALIGNYLLKKATLKFVKTITHALLVIIALTIIFGLV